LCGGQVCIPFPLPRGRGGDLDEGLAPLLNTLFFHSGRVKERLRLSYPKLSPSPLRERACLRVAAPAEARDNGGEGVSEQVKSPKSEAKIEAFEN